MIFIFECFCHEKIKFISSSRCVMFFLLYRQKNIDKIIEGNYRNYVIGKPRGLGQPLVRQLNPSLTHGFFQSTSTWAKITKARNIHIILGALVLATSNNRSIPFKQTIDMSKSLCAKIFL